MFKAKEDSILFLQLAMQKRSALILSSVILPNTLLESAITQSSNDLTDTLTSTGRRWPHLSVRDTRQPRAFAESFSLQQRPVERHIPLRDVQPAICFL